MSVVTREASRASQAAEASRASQAARRRRRKRRPLVRAAAVAGALSTAALASVLTVLELGEAPSRVDRSALLESRALVDGGSDVDLLTLPARALSVEVASVGSKSSATGSSGLATVDVSRANSGNEPLPGIGSGLAALELPDATSNAGRPSGQGRAVDAGRPGSLWSGGLASGWSAPGGASGGSVVGGAVGAGGAAAPGGGLGGPVGAGPRATPSNPGPASTPPTVTAATPLGGSGPSGSTAPTVTAAVPPGGSGPADSTPPTVADSGPTVVSPAAPGTSAPATGGAPGSTPTPVIISTGPVEGFGPIDGPVTVVPGGILAPGASPGELTLNDDFRLFGGILEIDIWGLIPGLEHDLLTVLGEAVFDSGAIQFVFTDDHTGTIFTPTVGDTFTFLTAAKGISGFDGNPNLFLFSDDLDSSLDFIVTSNGNALTLAIIEGNGARDVPTTLDGPVFEVENVSVSASLQALLSPNAVSAPGTLALQLTGLALVLAGLAIRRRRSTVHPQHDA